MSHRSPSQARLPPWALANHAVTDRAKRITDYRLRVLACVRTNIKLRDALIAEAERWESKTG